MLNQEVLPSSWGIRPVIFELWGFGVPSYSFFVLLALLTALFVYGLTTKKTKSFNENAFYIVVSALAFGTLGSKLPIWIANYRLIIDSFPDMTYALSGRTIVGGLIGGFLGVAFVKRKLNIKDRIGNQIAPAAAIGMAVGRIGCFLRGCCYGKATGMLWGVNFGDGILRHPTQLYEAVFDVGLFIYLMSIRKSTEEPGKLFRILVNGYFIFRFFVEFIRVEPVLLLGLTGYQLATLAALVFINRKLIVKRIKGKQVQV